MVRYFFRISYIGTKYRGSQKGPEFPGETVQSVIENALCSLDPQNVPMTSFASRTDKGVHALMNTFHVDLEHKKAGESYQPSLMRRLLNSYLRQNNQEILVTNASVVPDDFHARFHVKWRRYIYCLAILKPELGVKFANIRQCEDYLPITQINRCHVVSSDLNIDVVKDVTRLYEGSYNFQVFTKNVRRDPWKTTKRVINEFKLYEVPPLNYMSDPQFSDITMWEFHIRSYSFLHHQIRKLVGCALAAGFGRISIEEIEAMLNNPSFDMSLKSPMAPACGLYLAHLQYGKEGFRGKDSNTEKISVL